MGRKLQSVHVNYKMLQWITVQQCMILLHVQPCKKITSHALLLLLAYTRTQIHTHTHTPRYTHAQTCTHTEVQNDFGIGGQTNQSQPKQVKQHPCRRFKSQGSSSSANTCCLNKEVIACCHYVANISIVTLHCLLCYIYLMCKIMIIFIHYRGYQVNSATRKVGHCTYFKEQCKGCRYYPSADHMNTIAGDFPFHIPLC